jgi:hypothetical protein
MHYYWYVVATDSHSASTASSTWDFTTKIVTRLYLPLVVRNESNE